MGSRSPPVTGHPEPRPTGPVPHLSRHNSLSNLLPFGNDPAGFTLTDYGGRNRKSPSPPPTVGSVPALLLPLLYEQVQPSNLG